MPKPAALMRVAQIITMFLAGSVVLLLAIRAALCCPNSQWLATGDGDCFLPIPPSMAEVTADDARDICHDINSNSSLPEILDADEQLMVRWIALTSN